VCRIHEGQAHSPFNPFSSPVPPATRSFTEKEGSFESDGYKRGHVPLLNPSDPFFCKKDKGGGKVEAVKGSSCSHNNCEGGVERWLSTMPTGPSE